MRDLGSRGTEGMTEVQTGTYPLYGAIFEGEIDNGRTLGEILDSIGPEGGCDHYKFLERDKKAGTVTIGFYNDTREKVRVPTFDERGYKGTLPASDGKREEDELDEEGDDDGGGDDYDKDSGKGGDDSGKGEEEKKEQEEEKKAVKKRRKRVARKRNPSYIGRFSYSGSSVRNPRNYSNEMLSRMLEIMDSWRYELRAERSRGLTRLIYRGREVARARGEDLDNLPIDFYSAIAKYLSKIPLRNFAVRKAGKGKADLYLC